MEVRSKYRWPWPSRAGLAALAFSMLAASAGNTAERDAAAPYVLRVADASAATGTQAAVVATLRLRDGYRFLQSYNNRVVMLSSIDDGVSFDREVVRGAISDGELIFTVNVSPTKPGKHPINGVIRVGYAEGAESMKMISVPLMATVTGTE